MSVYRATIHFAVATKNVSYGGDLYIPYFLMSEDIVLRQHTFENGLVSPNTAPGLGVELNEKIIAKYKI